MFTNKEAKPPTLRCCGWGEHWILGKSTGEEPGWLFSPGKVPKATHWEVGGGF